MKTRADELKQEIVKCDEELAWNREVIDELEQRIGWHRRDIDGLLRQRATLQEQLEREVAPMEQRQPKGIKAGPINV